jgi:phospholipid/cholesterol/gamma-HCH transport system substrate-binding protein
MTRTARLGAFIVGALILFAVGVFLIGERQYLFTPTYRLHAAFDTVAGLDDGAVVRSGGVRIGTVQKIRMPRHSGEKVTVVMRLEKGTREVIKKDSVATVETEGLLGAKYVSVSFGSRDSEPVQDGDTIASRPPLEYADLAKKAGELMDTTKSAFRDLHGTMAETKASVRAFHDNMEALKQNRLLRGFFDRRGYRDPAELTAHEIRSLPNAPPAKTFVYAAQELFDKADTAKLRHEKSLDQVGEFLQATPFGLAIVTAYTGPEGEKAKNLELAQARATVVRSYLVNTFRVDDARIKTKGMGEDARTDAKRASRVEILVYPSENGRRRSGAR